MKFFYSIIANTISEETKGAISKEEIEAFLEMPKKAEFGDISLPCFKFSKQMRKAPVKIADDFKLFFESSEAFEEVTNVNGYLNFKFNRELATKNFIERFRGNSFFEELKELGKGKKVVIEYSSLNIAKEPHIAHLRSTGIGNALYLIYKELGWQVIRVNYLGDWGTQFGKLIYAYQKWGDEKELSENPVRYLMKLYVRFHDEANQNESLNEFARECFNKLENKDEEYLRLWELFREYTLQKANETYARLNIEFDSYKGEAYYNDLCKDVINEIKNSPVGTVSEGALVVDLKEYDMPPCLIQKSDGASIYATRDLAAARERFEEYNFDKMLYVVGVQQSLHFKQFFKVLELLGYDFVDRCEHVAFGTILGISTRKGNAPYLNEIFDDARDKALKIIEEKNPNMENKEEIAEKIGVGAISFQDLSKQRIKDSEFDWDRIISFEGETGPYIQYSSTRVHNILKKLAIEIDADIDYSVLNDDASYELLKTNNSYPKKLQMAYNENEPYIIANYLIELSKKVNQFYRNNRVVGEEERVLKARALLLDITLKIMKKCMMILGIPFIDRM